MLIIQLESSCLAFNYFSIKELNFHFAVPEVVNGNMLTATVVGLNAWVEHEFRVVARNAVGLGEPSPASAKSRTEDASMYIKKMKATHINRYKHRWISFTLKCSLSGTLCLPWQKMS